MPHKKFSAPIHAEGAEAVSPVTFDLSGQTTANGKDPEPWTETFTCVSVVPAGVLDDLAASMSWDDQGNQIFNAPSLIRFATGILIDADVNRFRELMHSKTKVVPIVTLGEIVMWLAEELVGHPIGK